MHMHLSDAYVKQPVSRGSEVLLLLQPLAAWLGIVTDGSPRRGSEHVAFCSPVFVSPGKWSKDKFVIGDVEQHFSPPPPVEMPPLAHGSHHREQPHLLSLSRNGQ